MSFQSFEDLEVWKKACQLAARIYDALKDCRDFGLKDQMQRAAVSIASNIAEGHERGGKGLRSIPADRSRFLHELRTQIYIARKIGILSDAPFQDILNELKQISKMLHGLNKSLKTEN